MVTRGRLFRGGLLLAFGVTVAGCPVTDNYFIDANQALNGGAGDSGSTGNVGTGETGGVQAIGGTESTPQGGKAQGGTEQGGSTPTGGTASAAGMATAGDTVMGGAPEVPLGGAPAGGQAGDPGAGGVPPTPCVPTTERCNGHDDNCNDLIDELACNSSPNGTQGCSGFVLSERPNHGYMFCTTNRKDWAHAKQACAAQEMRLAWLESDAENREVSQKVKALTNDTDVWMGADDQANEGEWFWDSGAQFWKGNQFGRAVNNSFEAWAGASPDNHLNSEDCGIFDPEDGGWADRNCNSSYAYLCEEPEP